ncbi:uncharacterized protein LACBIDRAFT_296664 [Laccaria bicolor S238N-H82]|uniref:Predicted protein n=1 Tax=Laccaria bicolor (strain S238N-H82 / ATCC MYA-4686) TaxID=486041 RepID=B0D9D5_LACBS|nr:uncharacterized protein LACBIDRAFT_296664 [Laccaria bicolor S238N-H82]EDR08999.1 predicted protein [Laccaria bicolor S238N-H82]|eukprot:XP_001880312.1 predicted protein [Laccaria bicolor S238N-H82]
MRCLYGFDLVPALFTTPQLVLQSPDFFNKCGNSRFLSGGLRLSIRDEFLPPAQLFITLPSLSCCSRLGLFLVDCPLPPASAPLRAAPVLFPVSFSFCFSFSRGAFRASTRLFTFVSLFSASAPNETSIPSHWDQPARVSCA